MQSCLVHRVCQIQWLFQSNQVNKNIVFITGLPPKLSSGIKSPVTARAFEKSGKEHYKTQCGQ
jgi:hypothetical protein